MLSLLIFFPVILLYFLIFPVSIHDLITEKTVKTLLQKNQLETS